MFHSEGTGVKERKQRTESRTYWEHTSWDRRQVTLVYLQVAQQPHGTGTTETGAIPQTTCDRNKGERRKSVSNRALCANTPEPAGAPPSSAGEASRSPFCMWEGLRGWPSEGLPQLGTQRLWVRRGAWVSPGSWSPKWGDQALPGEGPRGPALDVPPGERSPLAPVWLSWMEAVTPNTQTDPRGKRGREPNDPA